MESLAPQPLADLRLKPQEERRLRSGHLWVYSNEVDTAATPLSDFTPGQGVVITDATAKPLGVGYVNPHSLICARLLSRRPQQPLDQGLLERRLQTALALRQSLFPAPYYRLVHGEGDGLPGLVVDRYGDVVVAQLNTAGMEQLKPAVLGALETVLAPRAIVLRNDAPGRELEGLERYVATPLGEAPALLTIKAQGGTFEAPLQGGQKTGWYYDHGYNRAMVAQVCTGLRVLDCFSYVGAWGIQAALAGAQAVVCVDSAQRALDQVIANAERNAVAARVQTRKGDAFDVLKALRAERERFDVVILDPPAFIKRRKDYKEGLRAYRRLNQEGMQIVEPGGWLFSASCSFHLSADELREVMRGAARHLDRELQVVAQGQQGPDHPVHPAIPETRYLKALFTRVLWP